MQHRAQGEGGAVSREPDAFEAEPDTPVPPPITGGVTRRERGSFFSTPAWVFWLLFSINVVNYLDRLLVVAVGPTIKAEFHLTDRTIGLLGSAFLIVYTIAALPLGLLADRVSRARVVAAGVALWSVMSGATAFARTFMGLVVTRAAVGIGEASYFPAGTALLSAYFPLERRAQANSRWGAGQIVGSALAFAGSAILFQWLGPRLGWRVAFLATAIPGLVLAVLMWQVRDTPAGAARSPKAGAAGAPGPAAPVERRDELREAAARIAQVLSIGTVRIGIVLQALIYIVVTPTVTFLTIYLRSSRSGFHLTDATAALLSGVVIVVGGLAGTLLGGYLAGWLSRRLRGGRLLAVGVSCALGLPCYVTMLLTHSVVVFVVLGMLGVLALNLQVGPLGASVQDATPPQLRASAVAVGLVIAHLIGDSWSPAAVGALSTRMGERTALGLLYVGTPALVLAVIVAVLGARTYARDVAARQREAAADKSQL
jgi:MFS transporter, Spinster family, sphingosine-1-phosphate transporter